MTVKFKEVFVYIEDDIIMQMKYQCSGLKWRCFFGIPWEFISSTTPPRLRISASPHFRTSAFLTIISVWQNLYLHYECNQSCDRLQGLQRLHATCHVTGCTGCRGCRGCMQPVMWLVAEVACNLSCDWLHTSNNPCQAQVIAWSFSWWMSTMFAEFEELLGYITHVIITYM